MNNLVLILLFFAVNGYVQSCDTFDIEKFEKNKKVLSRIPDATDTTKCMMPLQENSSEHLMPTL